MTQSVFDAHLRIIDPAHPLLENNGYLPDAFTVADYQHRIARLGMHADGLPQLLRLVEQGVKVKATSKRSKLAVDVNPNKGKGYWRFQVQRLDNGKWVSLKTYKTKGKKEKRTVNLRKGTYRVVVLAKYGYGPTPSGAVVLVK